MSAVMVQLGEVVDLQAGFGFPKRFQGRSSGDYPFAKVGDISRIGRSSEDVIQHADHYVDEADLKPLKAKLIPAGSVVFAKIGEAIRHNHRAVVGCNLLVDNNAMAAIPSNRITSRYLYHFLRCVDFYALASATTVPALRKSVLARIPIPLPPLSEQKRIAGILDAADALRAKRREALAQLDTLLQATFLNMFGDPVATPGIKSAVMTEVVSRFIDYRGKSPEKSNSGIPLITAKIVKDKEVRKPNEFIPADSFKSWMSRGIPNPGDVIITTEAPMGEVALVPEYKAAFAQRLLVLQPNTKKVNSVYLLWALTMPFVIRQLQQRSTGSTVTGIRSKEFKKVSLPLPNLDLQQRFAALVISSEQQRSRMRAHLAELDSLFASLQQRAFAGEL